MLWACGVSSAWAEPVAADAFQASLDFWRAQFVREVSRQPEVTQAEQQGVLNRVKQSLFLAKWDLPDAQCVLVVDRSPRVQAAYLVVYSPEHGWHGLGATAVSTGKP